MQCMSIVVKERLFVRRFSRSIRSEILLEKETVRRASSRSNFFIEDEICSSIVVADASEYGMETSLIEYGHVVVVVFEPHMSMQYQCDVVTDVNVSSQMHYHTLYLVQLLLSSTVLHTQHLTECHVTIQLLYLVLLLVELEPLQLHHQHLRQHLHRYPIE